MKTRTLVLNPKTSFQPRASTVYAWLSTQKKAITMGGRDGPITHHGFFDSHGVVWLVIWLIVVVILEVFSLSQLRVVGAFENPAVLVAFMAVDFIAAALAHSGTAGRRLYLAQRELAETADERVWAGAFAPALWRSAIRWLGIIALGLSALAKSVFFVLNAEFTATAIAVPFFYGLVFWAHVSKTGYLLAEIWFRFLLRLDWRRFAQGDPDLRWTYPKTVEFRPRNKLASVRVNNQTLTVNGDGRAALVICGLLQDDEAADLADVQPTPEAKAEVLRRCYAFQVASLNLNPNQEISVPSNTPGAQSAATGIPAGPILTTLVVLCALLLPSCAKPKAKVSAVQTIDVQLFLPMAAGDALPRDVADLTAPFEMEGRAIVANLAIRDRAPDGNVREANFAFASAGQKTNYLNLIFGASGTPLEDLKQQWTIAARQPLRFHAPSPAVVAAPDCGEFIRTAAVQPGPAAVLEHACSGLPPLSHDITSVKSAAEFKNAVIRVMKSTPGNERAPLIVLFHGFTVQSPPLIANARGTADSSNQASPVPLAPHPTIPPVVEKRLPEAVRAVLDRGSSRVLTTVYFGDGSPEVPRPEFAELDRVAGELRPCPGTKVIILAHADRRGSDEANARLSRERALAVARELQRRGIPVAAALGLSDALPVDGTSTELGLGLNRRADVVAIEEDPVPESAPRAANVTR